MLLNFDNRKQKSISSFQGTNQPTRNLPWVRSVLYSQAAGIGTAVDSVTVCSLFS